MLPSCNKYKGLEESAVFVLIICFSPLLMDLQLSVLLITQKLSSFSKGIIEISFTCLVSALDSKSSR